MTWKRQEAEASAAAIPRPVSVTRVPPAVAPEEGSMAVTTGGA